MLIVEPNFFLPKSQFLFYKKCSPRDLCTMTLNVGDCETFWTYLVKFIYSEKATKFCEIFTLLLSHVVPVKSKVKISQNFVAFSEYVNFNIGERYRL